MFENGAMKVPLVVSTTSMPPTPRSPSMAIVPSSGRGVILSIMVHGNVILLVSLM